MIVGVGPLFPSGLTPPSNKYRLGDGIIGQYHKPYNLDKKECLDPHRLGDGLKLKEQGLTQPGGVMTALHVLLAVSSGRGGGDYGSEHMLASKVVGRWGGDRIAIIGDYAEPSDIPGENAQDVYGSDGYLDITDMVRDYLAEGVDDYYHAFSYDNDPGWVRRSMEMVRRDGR